MVVPSSPEGCGSSAARTERCERGGPVTTERETCALCGADLGGKNIAERLAHGDECFERMQLLEESRSFRGASRSQPRAERGSPAGLLSLVEESDDEDFKDSPSTPSQCSDRSGSGIGMCPICSKALSYSSEQRRSQHVSRCIEAQEKRERDAEEDETPSPRKGKGKRKKRFTPQAVRVRHACTACDQDLTSMNQGERIKHYKRCHAQKGTRLQVLQQVRGIKDGIRHINTTGVLVAEGEKEEGITSVVEIPSTSPEDEEEGFASTGGSTQEERLTASKGRRARATSDEAFDLEEQKAEVATKPRGERYVIMNEKLASVTGARAYTRSVRQLPIPEPIAEVSDDTQKGPAGFSVPLTPQEREEKRKKALEVMFDTTQHSPKGSASPTRARAGRRTAFSESRLANSAARAPRSLWKMSTATIDISLGEHSSVEEYDGSNSTRDTADFSGKNMPVNTRMDGDEESSGCIEDDVMRERVEAIVKSYNEECARLHEVYVSSIGRAAIERDRLLRELCNNGSACYSWNSLPVPDHPRPPGMSTAPDLLLTTPLKRTRSEPLQLREPAPAGGREREPKKRKLSLFAASEHSGSDPNLRSYEMELLSPTPQSGSSM